MNHSTQRVLLLDDDPFMLKLLRRMLGKLGYTATTISTSGLKALELLASSANWPELILVDLNMPEMDGIEFVRKLAECGYDGGLILVSGEDERMLQAAKKLVQAHHIEFVGFLRKPVMSEVLAAVLADWQPMARRPEQNARPGYSPQRIAQAILAGELVNYYQPKVEIASGRLAGVEALVRWQHPDDGLVGPDKFVGIAEDSGVIDALTHAVIDMAFEQASLWRRAGFNLRMAVNVSMVNLATLSFVEQVARQAMQADVLPQQIVLEVTESRVMEDPRISMEILGRLRLKRFKLSIDDFGTGHSSLSQLCDLPFDELKIDQRFVHRAGVDPTLRAIFMASRDLARTLDMEVVAEGVEDLSDWEFLRSSGGDLAQGYFIGRPMSADELPAWMASWQARLPGLLHVNLSTA